MWYTSGYMDTLLKADIFFVISSVGFMLITLFALVFFSVLVAMVFQMKRLIKKVETHVGDIGEEMQALILDLRESFLFKMFVRRKRKK